MGEPQPTRAGGPTAGVLRGLPSTPPAPRPTGREELIVHAARVAGRLAARATLGEGVLAPVAHGEVALELRHLLPLVDDLVVDEHLARLERAARFVTSAETAQGADPSLYASAAWDAGLDLADVAADVEALRASVIEHWDQTLLQVVVDLVDADRSVSVADGGGTAVRAG